MQLSNLVRQLKKLGMSCEGLVTFYRASIRTTLTYAATEWYFLLSKQDRERIECIQRSATPMMLPDKSYEPRMCLLGLDTIDSFVHSLSRNHFNKIAKDFSHPLNNRVIMNNARSSARNNTQYRPSISRTAKRHESFFPFFMRYFNQGL